MDVDKASLEPRLQSLRDLASPLTPERTEQVRERVR